MRWSAYRAVCPSLPINVTEICGNVRYFQSVPLSVNCKTTHTYSPSYKSTKKKNTISNAFLDASHRNETEAMREFTSLHIYNDCVNRIGAKAQGHISPKKRVNNHCVRVK